MAAGAMIPNTEMSGNRPASPVIGHPIATATGPTFLPGDGPGLKTSLGVLPPSTTVAGRTPETAGAGYQVRSQSRQSMPRPWLPSSAEPASASESELAQHP